MQIRLNVPQIMQKPELPNGCEITSLCEVLTYLGFSPDKCDLSDNYLPQSQHWYGVDPNLVYMGNPRFESGEFEGFYCFAGPVIAAAKKYINQHGGGFEAVDLTGSEEDDLINQLKEGRPFIFWASLHFDDIQFEDCEPYALSDGSLHQVFHMLHCMVCCGVDDEFFYVADPLGYNDKVPRDQFMKIYRQLGKRALTIKNL